MPPRENCEPESTVFCPQTIIFYHCILHIFLRTATGKLRSLNKIVSVLPELGPLKDVNDLLEKHNMSSEAAVNICRNILRSGTNPTPEPVVGKSVKTHRSRKLSALKKAVNPEVTDVWKTE